MSSHYVLKIQYVNKPPETRNIGARVTTIGREAGDIVLGDPQSSGRHAEIHFENGTVRVKDLGSTNGTFFNGQRTPEFTMQPGQGFSIGQTVVTLMAINTPQQQRAGAGKTMVAMGGVPPRPPGPAGAPPPGAPPRPAGAPPGAPPQGFGAPPPSAPPQGFGAPPPSAPPQGFGAPPPSQPPQGFGAPPPSAPPQGFGAPPPSQPGPFGAAPSSPPAFGAPAGGQPAFGGPPSSPPPGGAFGGPPPGGAPFGGPPPGSPPPGGAMAPAAFGGPAPSFGGGAMATAPGGEIRGDFSGTGGELLGQLLVGYLLTLITFGIYAPWFVCKLMSFMASRTSFGPTARGALRFSFEGKGGELFVTFIVGYLLTLVTIGIYMPWFMCKIQKFYTDNTIARTDDGTEYRPRFDGKGGELLVTFIVGYLLTLVTIGIYMPWFICKLNKWFMSNTKITKQGGEVGGMDFTGQGGELLVTFIVGYLLTLITFGIYMAWFQVKMLKFNAEHTKLQVEGRQVGFRFTGEGGELFVMILVGYLLSMLTLGIYSFWFMAKLLKWQLSNTVAQVEGGGMGAVGPGAYGGGYPAMGGAPPQGQLGYGQPAGYGQPGAF